jgi:transcriptional regulator with XRE-family HTH domain
MSLGERIKSVRKECRLSQKEFGARINISDGHLSAIEKNKDKPSDRLIDLICINFGINEEWLRTGKGDKFIATPKSRLMFNEFIQNADEYLRNKPDDVQKMIVSIFNSCIELVDKVVAQDIRNGLKPDEYSSQTQKRLAVIRAMVDKIGQICLSDYLPVKELWENGELSQMEFYKRKREIFKKHMSAVESYMEEAFDLRCAELFFEYQANYDKIDMDEILKRDEISKEILDDPSYFKPEYFKKFDKKKDLS